MWLTPQQEDRALGRVMVANAVNRLTQKQRAVVALRSAGYSQRECGEVVGLTRAAVGFIHKGALESLKRMVIDGNT